MIVVAAGRIDDPRLPARVWERIEVDLETGCWLWIGSLKGGGYGQTSWRGKNISAHRLVYQELVGPIPAGLDLDHLCRVRRCCNPVHLEPKTRRANLLAGETIPAAHAAKTHCPAGHPYDGANTYLRNDNGARLCRACDRDRHAARRSVTITPGPQGTLL